MERIRFIEHRGNRVLFIDMTDCTPEEMAKVADLVPPYVTSEQPGSVLLLADFTGSKLTREAVERIKVAAVFNRPHLKRSAWVGTPNGANALREAVETFSVRNIPSFPTREEALEFLVA